MAPTSNGWGAARALLGPRTVRRRASTFSGAYLGGGGRARMHAFESVALSSSPATSFRPSSVLISTGAKTSSVASFRGTGRAVLTREKGHHTFLACVVRLCVNDACRHLWLFGERLDGAVVGADRPG